MPHPPTPKSWHVTYLIGPGSCEAAESPGPTHSSLQLAALGCGTGIHPYWAVADGEAVLERKMEVQASTDYSNPGTGSHTAHHIRNTLCLNPLWGLESLSLDDLLC